MNESKKITLSGREIAPLYPPPATSGVVPEVPGEFPYTRGVHKTMYRDRLWTMRQYAGFGTVRESNERYRHLLAQGSTGLSVAFDLPTQMGRDPDHQLARGEVGKVGVSIATVADMRQLLDGIPLEKVSVSMTINATAGILLAMVLVVAEERGVPWRELTGTIQNDILKEYIARGTYIYPPRPALRLVTDIFRFCRKEVPKWNTISVSGYHIREAGSTAVDEVAFTLADGLAYLDAARAAGLSVDDVAPRMAFFFNGQIDFLEEIAKFRAARRLWAELVKERYAPADPRSLQLRFHTQTAGSSLTAQQPLVNVVRTTVEAMAAVLGGTQSLHTNSYDEALGLPTAAAAELALRTQQVIAYESGIPSSIDPLAGSYLIEAWTDEIAVEARRRIRAIDELGGMVLAIEQEVPQRAIEQSAYEYQQRVERGEQVVVGVNRFCEGGGASVPVMRVDGAAEQEAIASVVGYRSRRDPQLLAGALATLREVARNPEGALMEATVHAIRSGATLGEISDVLRHEFGEFRGG